MGVQVKQLVEERDKEDKEEQEEMATRIDELKYVWALQRLVLDKFVLV